MYDILPFPNLNGSSPMEQLAQVNDYLIRLKEELEFILTNISADNLSGDLRKKLESLGADVETYKVEQQDATEQIVKNSLTVSDVLNSAAYSASLKAVLDQIPKEYLVSAEQTVESGEPGGINIYATTDSSGKQTELKVMNGKTPAITFEVNYQTGNLEYKIT